MHTIHRVIDANANRAREALRVLEDAARFLLDDHDLSGSIKQIRHDLRDALTGSFPPGVLEANRDTPNDVGTTITTSAELDRADVVDVVTAAGKRLSEALRVIEEYGKIAGVGRDATAPAESDPTVVPLSATIEAMRYRCYEIERGLTIRLGSGRAIQWGVCVLLTESLCRLPWLDVLDAVIGAGVDCVQLREKDLPDGRLLGRATVVAKRCRAAGVTSIVNDRPDIALAAGADGVHVGQDDLPVAFIRRLAGRRLIVGVSTSRIEQAEAAVRSGADYCGLGPMFHTTTKTKPQLAGPEYVSEYVGRLSAPHLAIGGVNPENVEQLVSAGARGVAVSSCVCGSEAPGTVVQHLRDALKQADG
ncbi:MAG: thiamine phosphate synthase [Planctomycetes bacterium]|nr:thiamine phosphate synthase [Planctomycetota bacterium]